MACYAGTGLKVGYKTTNRESLANKIRSKSLANNSSANEAACMLVLLSAIAFYVSSLVSRLLMQRMQCVISYRSFLERTSASDRGS